MVMCVAVTIRKVRFCDDRSKTISSPSGAVCRPPISNRRQWAFDYMLFELVHEFNGAFVICGANRLVTVGTVENQHRLSPHQYS
jgi:hypothetical protein